MYLMFKNTLCFVSLKRAGSGLRKTEGQRQNFPLLLHSPKAHSSQTRKQKP